MADSRYAKNAGAVFAVFALEYHIVWKYRRPVLVRPVDTRLKALLKDIASEHDMTIPTR
jgi:REP element-mobilizing transposase RayT